MSVTETPCECTNSCEEPDRKSFGCGYRDEYRGKATSFRSDKLTITTCPQWWILENHSVRVVFDMLADYRRGALGNVLDLPADLYDCLRIADCESARWDQAAQEQVNEG